MPVDLKDFYYKNVVVTAEKSLEIAKQTSSQCEQKWFYERNLRITGSKCYGLFIYSCNFKKNKNANWEKKITSTFKSSFVGNESTMYGIHCEPLARNAYSIKSGRNVAENGLYVDPLTPWLGCSVDGLIVDDQNNPEFSIEIKSFTSGKTVPASESLNLEKCFEKDKSLKMRHEYYGQSQLGLLLLGLPTCDLVVYSSFNDSMEIVLVQFDMTFAVKMVTELVNVYFDIVLPWLKKSIQGVSGRVNEEFEEGCGEE